jgi:hypothetical protein
VAMDRTTNPREAENLALVSVRQAGPVLPVRSDPTQQCRRVSVTARSSHRSEWNLKLGMP